MHVSPSLSPIQVIDRSIKTAFIYLEALDRRTLAGLNPAITTAQYYALNALAAVPQQSLGALATRLLCDKANASGLMDRLVPLGLASRERDPEDGRRVVVSITPAGSDVLERATEMRLRALARALAPVDDTSRGDMARDLAQLVEALQAAVFSEGNSDRQP